MFIVGLLVLSQYSPYVEAINCYECDSFDDFTCTEIWDPELDVNLSFLNNCSHVSGAKYCIKMTGIYQGKLGAKRLCSSKDWGNYCEYVKRPGDIQEYESCIFSCSSEECNSSDIIRSISSLPLQYSFNALPTFTTNAYNKTFL